VLLLLDLLSTCSYSSAMCINIAYDHQVCLKAPACVQRILLSSDTAPCQLLLMV
jgi:hypothetical protein